jgi:hypothetical protein
MTILLLMVGFLAEAFNAASTAWRQGEHDVERFSQARATIDLMTHDLRQAIVNTNLQFYASTNCLAFMAPVNDNSNYADLAEVVYILNWNDPTVPPASQNNPPFKLLRRLTRPTDSQWSVYLNPATWPATYASSNLVCDSIVNFSLTYYDTNNNATVFWNSTPTAPGWTEPVLGQPVPLGGYSTMTNMPPAYINVHLEVVDSATARLLTNFPAGSPAYVTLTNRAVRAFDTYIKIPQR